MTVVMIKKTWSYPDSIVPTHRTLQYASTTKCFLINHYRYVQVILHTKCWSWSVWHCFHSCLSYTDLHCLKAMETYFAYFLLAIRRCLE